MGAARFLFFDTMKRRVLILAMSYPPQAVGTGSYAYTLACGLAARGHQPLVLAPSGQGDEVFDAASAFAVHRFELPRSVPLRYVRARSLLKEQIEAFAPDCTWATNGMSTRVVGMLNCWDRQPLITSMRGSDVVVRLSARGFITHAESALQRRAYAQSAAIAAVSRFVRNCAVAQGVDGRSIFIHPPAWQDRQTQDFCYDPASFFIQFPLLKGRRIVLSVARLVAQKRVDKVLQAGSRLLKEFPDMVQVVVGDGPERKKLERLARELGWQDRVLFVGALMPRSDALFAIYSAAEVFVLPSVREGMGNVFIEAGAFGLPCLGVSGGGVSECIEEGKSGLLSRADDVEDLCAKLRFILKDPKRAREMGAAGREKVRAEYSEEALADRAVEVLESVC